MHVLAMDNVGERQKMVRFIFYKAFLRLKMDLKNGFDLFDVSFYPYLFRLNHLPYDLFTVALS